MMEFEHLDATNEFKLNNCSGNTGESKFGGIIT